MSKTNPHTELDEALYDLFISGINYDGGSSGDMGKPIAKAKAALTAYISREVKEIIGEKQPATNASSSGWITEKPQYTHEAKLINLRIDQQYQRAKAKGYDV